MSSQRRLSSPGDHEHGVDLASHLPVLLDDRAGKDKEVVDGFVHSGQHDSLDSKLEADSDDSDQLSYDRSQIPMRYRLLALSMILFFSTGSSFCEDTISPNKSLLKSKLGLTNAQYGTISSASSLVNTILPILGGIGMDYWGATYAAIIASIFVCIGAVLSAAGANAGGYGLVIGGRILMGFGSTVIESTQSKLYSHWFTGSNLALVYAVDIAWNRITSVISINTAVPMSRINGWWGWFLWIPAITTFVTLGLTIAYWAYERSVPLEFRPVLGKDARRHEGALRKRLSWNTLSQLPIFFWVLCGTQLFQSSAVTVYSSNLADMQTQTRGTSTLAAGYNSSLQGVIPIVLTPLVGMFFDRFGWRMLFVSLAGSLYIVVFTLVGLTTVPPLAPILLSSFTLSFNAITFVCAIPVLVGDDRLLGTAFGIWKAFNNAGAIVLDVASGAIQDRSKDGSYNNVVYFLVAIKAFQVCLGPIYDFLDGRWLGHSLRMNESRRLAFRREAQEKKLDMVGWRVSKVATYTVLTELGMLIVVAWVVYIVYSLGT